MATNSLRRFIHIKRVLGPVPVHRSQKFSGAKFLDPVPVHRSQNSRAPEHFWTSPSAQVPKIQLLKYRSCFRNTSYKHHHM